MPNHKTFRFLKFFALFTAVSQPLRAAGPVDGNWNVERMLCAGEAANAQTEAMYSGGNSITVQINDAAGAFVDTIDGCKKTIPLAFEYPDLDYTAIEGRLIARFNGPIQCTPAECDEACGADLPLVVEYDAQLNSLGNELTWKSIGAVDDNCSKNEQGNPITYFMRRG